MENSVFISKKCNNIINISSLVTLHYFEFDKDYVFPGESHPFWELLYVDKGQFLVTCNGEEHLLHSGEAIFHKPDEFHDNKSYNGIPANIFVITFVCNSKAMKFFNNKIFKFQDIYKQLIGNIIQTGRLTYEIGINDVNAIELVQRSDSIIGGQQLIRLYLEQLLILLLQADIKKTNNDVYDSIEIFDDMLVNEIIDILKDHVYSNIRIEDICDKLNYSKTYLSTFFKSKTQKSIIEYYRSLKIKEAKLLLRCKEYNISQISNLLHFANPYYFSNVFKSFTGMSPREYKNLVENKTNKI